MGQGDAGLPTGKAGTMMVERACCNAPYCSESFNEAQRSNAGQFLFMRHSVKPFLGVPL